MTNDDARGTLRGRGVRTVRARAAWLAGLAWLAVPALLSGCGSDRRSEPAGTFEATVVDVSPVVSGRLLAVGTDEGMRVARGDTLLVLDLGLTARRRAESLAARATLEAQRRVAQDELAQAERQAALLETTLARASALLAEGSATRQRVDDLTAERDVARSRVEAARGRLGVIDADIARAAAGVAVLDRQLEDGVVLSPIDGTVLVRSAEPGEVASPGRTALRLADLSTLELRVYLEAGDLARVKLDQELPVAVDALPGERFTGRVTWISDEAEFTPKNAQTRQMRAQLVYAVKLDVANPDGRLHVGMPAEVALP